MYAIETKKLTKVFKDKTAVNNIDLKFAMNIPKDWALEIISEEEFQMLEKLVKERGDVDESNRAFPNYRTES